MFSRMNVNYQITSLLLSSTLHPSNIILSKILDISLASTVCLLISHATVTCLMPEILKTFFSGQFPFYCSFSNKISEVGYKTVHFYLVRDNSDQAQGKDTPHHLGD